MYHRNIVYAVGQDLRVYVVLVIEVSVFDFAGDCTVAH